MSTDPGTSSGGSPLSGLSPGGSTPPSGSPPLSGSPPPSEFPPGGSPTSGGLPAVGSPQGVKVSQGPAKGTVDQSKHGHKDTDNEFVASTPGTSNKVVSRTSKLRLSASSSAVKPRDTLVW